MSITNVKNKSRLNPLKRVNSILTYPKPTVNLSVGFYKSQSPQTGQFNSYNEQEIISHANTKYRLNPLKRVNSILTLLGFKYHTREEIKSLNPLKRVNSILTRRL